MNIPRSIFLRTALAALLFSLGATSGYSQVVLNEIMASNQETISDSDGDYSDWIELFNAGSEAINLQGYGLSDDYDDPFRWEFPAVTMLPGEFLLVWASGKDRRNTFLPLHSNFSLASAGEEVLLTDPEGNRLDELLPTHVPADVSLGRSPDGSGDWYFFTEPTPGSSNATEGYQDFLELPSFSHTGGFYSEEITLTLAHSDEDVAIHYTLDGSEPTTESPVANEPIQISSRVGETNDISEIRTYYNVEAWRPPEGEVFKATVVRAKAFKPGAVSSKSLTHTYFIDPEEESRFSLPVVSIATEREGLFDPHTGIYVPGVHYESGNAWSGNYFQRGPEWERPISIEMYESDGSLAFAQNAGVRIHGGFSRAVPYKTLRIYARREYDPENWINYQIFPDRPLGAFKRILLRNSGNDWGGHPWATFNNSQPGTMFRDPLMQRLVEHLNMDTQGYRPAIVFINGEYWGIHNFRQRYDPYYFESNYGIEEHELDLLTQNGTVTAGSSLHYWELMDFVGEEDMSRASSFRHVKTLMDVDNFIEYYIAQIYFDNTDWPHNNIDYWRYRREGFNPGALPGQDGRLRWALFDTDFGFGLGGDHNPGAGFHRNTMAHAARSGTWSTVLFRELLENESFKHDFINRFADHLNSTFSSERVVAEINEMQSAIAPEVPEHLRRWRYPDSPERWEENVEVMRTFGRERPHHVRNHVMQQFGIQGTWDLTIDVSGSGYVQVNRLRVTSSTPGVPQDPYPWTGTYFQSLPITLTAVPSAGYRFSEWQGLDENSNGQTVTLNQQNGQSMTLTAVFEPETGDPMNPDPHRLADGPYTFSYWPSNQPAHTYPPAMVFQQTSTADPTMEDEMESLWVQPYNLSSRSRIVGLDDFGVAFINTSNAQEEEGSGYLGAAVLALNTMGTDSVFVSWRGGTPRPNSQVYNLRLQYRVGTTENFRDVTDRFGNLVEYRRNSWGGHTSLIGPHPLPAEAVNQDYIQLRWKYYFTGDRADADSGQRTMLRLADIRVDTSSLLVNDDVDVLPPDRLELHQNFPNPFGLGTSIRFGLPQESPVRLTVYDILGREVAVLVDGVKPAAEHTIYWDTSGLPSGVYFYRLDVYSFSQTRKMTLLRR